MDLSFLHEAVEWPWFHDGLFDVKEWIYDLYQGVVWRSDQRLRVHWIHDVLCKIKSLSYCKKTSRRHIEYKRRCWRWWTFYGWSSCRYQCARCYFWQMVQRSGGCVRCSQRQSYKKQEYWIQKNTWIMEEASEREGKVEKTNLWTWQSA